MEIETYRGTIYPWHCDFNDHMNVQHYIGKFDQATWHFLASLGITPQYLKESNKAMVAVEQNIKYYEEVNSGDLIHIRTVLHELKSKAVIFTHKMYNSSTDNCIAEGRMVGVHIDKEDRRSTPLPDVIMKKSIS